MNALETIDYLLIGVIGALIAVGAAAFLAQEARKP